MQLFACSMYCNHADSGVENGDAIGVGCTITCRRMAKPLTIEPVSCSMFFVNLFICNDCCLSMSSIFSRSRFLIANVD